MSHGDGERLHWTAAPMVVQLLVLEQGFGVQALQDVVQVGPGAGVLQH